jgi:hypothetical protein
MKNVALDFAAAVGDGLATSKFSAGLHVHVPGRSGHQRGIDSDADGHGNVAALGQRDHAERVFEAPLRSDIFRNDSDGANIELWRVQCERVVGSRVRIENNFAGRRRNERCGDSDQPAADPNKEACFPD